MRYLFLFFIPFTLLLADEIQRVDVMLQGITKLRSDYEQKLSEQKDINTQLKNQILNLNQKKECKRYIKIQKIIKTADVNKFPKLTMKHEYKHFKALSFRLNRDANIYDSIDGKQILTWEKGTSFTSHTKTEGWIKVTGYFVNKLWRSASKELWVRANDAQVRK